MTDVAYMEKKKLAFCAVKKAMDMLVEVTETNCGPSSSLPDMPALAFGLPKPGPSTLPSSPPATNTTVASPPLILSPAVKSDKDKLKEDIDGTLAELEGKGDSNKADLDSVSALIDTLEKKDQKSYKDRVEVIMNSIRERDEFLTKINDATNSGTLGSIKTNLNNFGSNSVSALNSAKTLTLGHTQFLRQKIDLKKDDLAPKESRIKALVVPGETSAVKPNLRTTAGLGADGSARIINTRSGPVPSRRRKGGNRRKTQKRR